MATAAPDTQTREPDFLGNFLSDLPPLPPLKQAEDAKPDDRQPPPKQKEDENGTSGPGLDGTADVPAKPDAVPADKPAEPAKVAPKADDGTEDKRPQSQKDWDAHKAKRKIAEDKLRSELETQLNRAKELETKLAEVEARANSKPAIDPELKAQLDAAQKRIDEFHKAFIRTDVEQDPDFRAHFGERVNDQLSIAKETVGPELAERTELILKMPEGEWKQAKLEELRAELTEGQKEDLAAVRMEMKRIEKDKQNAIKQAVTQKEKDTADKTAAAEKEKAELHQKVEQLVAYVKDPKTGLDLYQIKDGDEEWNKGVKEREAAVRQVLTTKIPPEVIGRLAVYGVAFPTLAAQYKSHVEALTKERDTLAAQVKKLSAAQPGAPKGGTANPGDPVGRSRPDPKATPNDHLNRFLTKMEVD